MKFWFRIVVSLLLLSWALMKLRAENIAYLLESINVGWSIFTLALLTAGIFWSARKWHLLLRCHGEVAPGYFALVRWYFMGSLANFFLPSGVGGDVLRIGLLAKSYGPLPQAASSVLMERLTGLAALIGIAAVAVWIIPSPENLSFLLPVYTVLLAGLTGGLIWSFLTRNDSMRFGKPNGLQTRFQAELFRWISAIACYRHRLRLLALAFLLSVVFQLQVIATAYVVARSFGIDLSWEACLLCIPLATLATLLPISINGVGVRESVYVFLLTQMGVAREEAFLVGLGTWAFVFLVSLAGGLIAIYSGGKKDRR